MDVECILEVHNTWVDLSNQPFVWLALKMMYGYYLQFYSPLVINEPSQAPIMYMYMYDSVYFVSTLLYLKSMHFPCNVFIKIISMVTTMF